ncbi:tetratricopeptide repeat protein [Actinoplanes subglobosus]|uniref:Tetratricopeptide repeat protein n=1 Tax=Actinoplanes subglobosus TaxID=1547892 RepID=A0ABV8IHZ8_9ACTN
MGLLMAAGATAALANFVWWWVAGLMGLVAGALGFAGSEVLARRQRMRQLGEDWAAVTTPWPATDAAQAAGHSVLAALNPTERVVRFNLLHQKWLNTLVRWCQDDDGGAVCLVQADAGEGKTRLLIEAVDELIEAGWVCGWLRPGKGREAVAVAARWQRPVLLLADDAATRGEVADLLIAAADEGPRVRVVLAARDFGAWWARLRSGLAREVAMATPSRPLILLPSLVGDARNRQQEFTKAVRAFADWFDAAAPQVVFAGATAAVPAVLLHAAAVVAVSDEVTGQVEADAVQQRLFEAEAAWWREQAVAADLDALGMPVLAGALVLAVLIGASSRDEAITLLRHLPGLGHVDHRIPGRVADWLRELYPQRTAAWLDPYLPGRLVERYAADQITERQALAEAVSAAARDDHAATRALEVLARAAVHTPRRADAFAAVITTDPRRLLPIAVQVTSSQAEPAVLDSRLAAFVTDIDLPPDVLDLLSQLLPWPSVALGWTAVEVARCQVRHTHTDDERASALVDLSRRLGDVGQMEDSLAIAREAVEAYRQLARDQPETYESHLAMSLTNLGARLTDVGQLEQALASSQETVELYRRLAQIQPEANDSNLAMALSNLSHGLAAAGRVEQAEAAAQEAVQIRRRLVLLRPEANEPNLAAALNNLASWLAGVGQTTQALDTVQEAVEIYRRLARIQPDAYEPYLAISLTNLGSGWAGIGQTSEALATAQEAVDIYRRLAQVRPEVHEPHLANSLTNLSHRLADAGESDQALATAHEAVDIRRRLAQIQSEAHEPHLAYSLHSLSRRLANVGQAEQALVAAQEAAAIRRRLAQIMPEAYESDLANSLHNLSRRLAEAGQAEQALTDAEEAVDIYRRLAQIRPEVHESDLANSLHYLSRRLAEVGQAEAALAAAQEAVGLYRLRYAAQREIYSDDLSMAVANLRRLRVWLGQPPNDPQVAQLPAEQRLPDELTS